MRALILATVATLALCGVAKADNLSPATIVETYEDGYLDSYGAIHRPAAPNEEFVILKDGTSLIRKHWKLFGRVPMFTDKSYGQEITRCIWRQAHTVWSCTHKRADGTWSN